MADAHIDGARIWYEVHGEGEDYLLQIGGAGFAHENFGFVSVEFFDCADGSRELPIADFIELRAVSANRVRQQHIVLHFEIVDS